MFYQGFMRDIDCCLIAAIMRIGMNEVKDFCLEYFPTTRTATFLEESCGISDIITSSIGGRNRQIAEAMVKQGKVRFKAHHWRILRCDITAIVETGSFEQTILTLYTSYPAIPRTRKNYAEGSKASRTADRIGRT